MRVVEDYLGRGDYNFNEFNGGLAKQWGKTDDGRVVLADYQNFKTMEEDTRSLAKTSINSSTCAFVKTVSK